VFKGLNKGTWHKTNSSNPTVQGDLTVRADIDKLPSLIVKGCYTSWRSGLLPSLPDFAQFPVMNSRYKVGLCATIRTRSCEMNSSGSRQWPVTRSCEHGNEHSDPKNL